MTLQEILIILQNRLTVLSEAKRNAVATGNLDQVVALENDIITTEQSILQITQALSL